MTRPAQLQPCPHGCGQPVFVWQHPATGITRTVQHTDNPQAPYTLDNGTIRTRRHAGFTAGLSDTQRGLPALQHHQCDEPQAVLW